MPKFKSLRRRLKLNLNVSANVREILVYWSMKKKINKVIEFKCYFMVYLMFIAGMRDIEQTFNI